MVSTEMDEEKVAKKGKQERRSETIKMSIKKRENGEQMRKKNGCRKRNVHR